MKITADLMPIKDVSPSDAALFQEWAWPLRTMTSFDPDTLSYPRSCMARANDTDAPCLFLPFHPVLMFESLITRPGLSSRKTALGLWRIGEQAEKIARDTGHGEGYFVTNSEDEVKATEKRGWIIVMHDPDKGLWLMKRKFGR